MDGITSLLNQGLGRNPVEQMSNENAIGANTGYPMAYMNPPTYAVPRNTPQPSDVIHGSQDTRVDPYTGEEKFADGGIVALGAGGLPTNIDGGMTFAEGGATNSDFSSQGILDFLMGRASQQPRYSQMRSAPVVGTQLYDENKTEVPRYMLMPDGTFRLADQAAVTQDVLPKAAMLPSTGSYRPEPIGNAGYVSPYAMRQAVLASGDQAGENYSHEGLGSVPRIPTFAEGIGNLASFLLPGKLLSTVIGDKNDYGSVASNLNTVFGKRAPGDVAPVVDMSYDAGTTPPGAVVEGPAPSSQPYTPVYADNRNATEASYTPSGSVDAYNLSGWGGGGGDGGDGGESTGSKAGGLMHEMAQGGLSSLRYNLGSYSDGGRLLKGPGDGVSDDIPAVIGSSQPARLADGEFVVPARIVSELGNGSTDAGARKLYAMMDRIQQSRKQTLGKGKAFAKDTKADKHLPK